MDANNFLMFLSFKLPFTLFLQMRWGGEVHMKRKIVKGYGTLVATLVTLQYIIIVIFFIFINALNYKYSMHSLFPPGTVSHVCSERHCSHMLPLTAIVRDRYFSIHYASVYWIYKQETASEKHTSQWSLLHRCHISVEASRRHTDPTMDYF